MISGGAAARKLNPKQRQKPFCCLRCSAAFGSRMELEEHINSHTGLKPFSCRVCHKRFNRRSSLWNHNRIHLDHKPFSCPLCNARFKWKNSLKCHRNMHVRQDPRTGTEFDLLSVNMKYISFGRSCASLGADYVFSQTRCITTRRSWQRCKQELFDKRHDDAESRRERAIKDLLLKFDKKDVHNDYNSWFDKVFGSLHEKVSPKEAKSTEVNYDDEVEAAEAAENLLALKRVEDNNQMNEENVPGSNSNCDSIGIKPFLCIGLMPEDKKYIKKLPKPVTKQEMDKVIKAHYADQSQFLYRNFEQPVRPYSSILLPKICVLWDEYN